jgi:uncharacterized membrane protein YphA (DoxX/SURF4 family)
MRVILGLSLLVQAGYYVRDPDAPPAAWIMGISSVLSAGLLLIGLLTPLVSSALVLGALGVWISLLPACTPTLFDSRAAIFAITILVAIVGLGPGAFSVDARLFGRREIVFPRAALGQSRLHNEKDGPRHPDRLL